MVMARWLRDLLSFLNGFRKLVICILALILGTIAVYTRFIDGPTYGKVLTITVPAYFAGNIGEHLTNSIKEWLARRKEA